jgi:hypothetical protein
VHHTAIRLIPERQQLRRPRAPFVRLEQTKEAAIRIALEKILGSPVFRSSGRMQRFLALVVNETLAGRAEQLKEYSIGVEAFDRPETFSPLTDPIVRVEARRLREKLAHYYQQHGSADEAVIEVPKGQYVPSFTFRSDEDRPGDREPALTVRPFTAVNTRAHAVREPLLYELVDQLVRVRGVHVKTGSETLCSGLILAGCVQTLPRCVRVVAQLIAAPQFDCQWSTAVNRSSSNGLVQSVAAAIAGKVAEYLSCKRFAC